LFSLSGGTLQKQLGEGTHLDRAVRAARVFYDVRSQTYTMSAQSTKAKSAATIRSRS
jgi:hypothetical protein